MKTATATVAILALVALSSAPFVSAANYTNIFDAVVGEGLTGLASLIKLVPGLNKTLSDPTLAVTLFAPSNTAVSDVLANADASLVKLVPTILFYHVSTNTSIVFKNGQILSTLVPANTTNTTNTLTVVGLNSTNTFYLGGVIPGALFNLSSKVSAGKSQMYIIDNVLVPPSPAFAPQTVVDLMVAAGSDFSTLLALVKASPPVLSYLSNKNLAATVFAPTNEAFDTLFKAKGVTLAQVAGTTQATTILLEHVIPTFPWTTVDLLVGTTKYQSAANSTLTLNFAFTNQEPSGTIQGVGNTFPAKILQFDLPAAMSAVLVIDTVLLPATNPPSPPQTGRRML